MSNNGAIMLVRRMSPSPHLASPRGSHVDASTFYRLSSGGRGGKERSFYG